MIQLLFRTNWYKHLATQMTVLDYLKILFVFIEREVQAQTGKMATQAPQEQE